MEFTAEAIDRIETLAVKASGAEAYRFGDDESGRVRVSNTHTGDISFTDLPTRPINARVFSINDLVATEREYCKDTVGSTVWVGFSEVRLLVDETRFGLIRMPMRVNPIVEVLRNMRNLTPKVLHRKLKIDLFSAEMAPFDFAEVIGSLTFKTNEINSDITDSLHVEFDMYPDVNLFTMVKVRCAVIAEPAEKTISVIPYPGELETAMNSAINMVATEIREKISKTTAVFCGTCS